MNNRRFNPLSGESAAGNAGNGGATDDDVATNEAAPAPSPFLVHCLPLEAEAMARAISEAEGTPLALAGCCVLGILSASIGSRLCVRSGGNRVTRGNLYILASAVSGSGKSETFRHAAAPLRAFENELQLRFQRETLPRLAARREILEADIARMKRRALKETGEDERAELESTLVKTTAELQSVDGASQAPILCVEDCTSERPATLLSRRDEQLASHSADAGSIVNNLLGRYSSLRRTDESIYLHAFSGDPCNVDRQSRLRFAWKRHAWPCSGSRNRTTLVAFRGVSTGAAFWRQGLFL